jgi:hypothetical protein
MQLGVQPLRARSKTMEIRKEKIAQTLPNSHISPFSLFFSFTYWCACSLVQPLQIILYYVHQFNLQYTHLNLNASIQRIISTLSTNQNSNRRKEKIAKTRSTFGSNSQHVLP